MKKSLHIMLIAMFVYVLFSFTSVYAAPIIPMTVVTYRLESDGRYKSLEGVTFTSDTDSIDFSYTVTLNDVPKTFTTSFVKDENIFTYSYKGSRTSEDAYYQALLDNVAVDAMFFAIGTASAIPTQNLTDMSKDFSPYTYAKYGFEVKTYDYTNTINGKAVSIKAIDSFIMNAVGLSVYGNADIIEELFPEDVEEPVAEPVEKTNNSKLIVLVVLVLVVLLVVALVVKSSKAKAAKKPAKKATAKKATTKKTK